MCRVIAFFYIYVQTGSKINPFFLSALTVTIGSEQAISASKSDKSGNRYQTPLLWGSCQAKAFKRATFA